jgi:hypothetical protein
MPGMNPMPGMSPMPTASPMPAVNTGMGHHGHHAHSAHHHRHHAIMMGAQTSPMTGMMGMTSPMM